MKHDKTLQNTWKPYMGELIFLPKSIVLFRCGVLINPLKEIEIVPFTKVKFFLSL